MPLAEMWVKICPPGERGDFCIRERSAPPLPFWERGLRGEGQTTIESLFEKD